MAKNAVVVARITACSSREKTIVTATAESISGGKRISIPLKVTNLATAGPKEGTWAIVMVATNPDYMDYADAGQAARRGLRSVRGVGQTAGKCYLKMPVLRGDPEALDGAWNALDLGSADWWREWKRKW